MSYNMNTFNKFSDSIRFNQKHISKWDNKLHVSANITVKDIENSQKNVNLNYYIVVNNNTLRCNNSCAPCGMKIME